MASPLRDQLGVDPVGHHLEFLEQVDQCRRGIVDAVQAVGECLIEQGPGRLAAQRAVDLVDETFGHGIGAEHVLGEGAEVLRLREKVFAGELPYQPPDASQTPVGHRGLVGDRRREGRSIG